MPVDLIRVRFSTPLYMLLAANNICEIQVCVLIIAMMCQQLVLYCNCGFVLWVMLIRETLCFSDVCFITALIRLMFYNVNLVWFIILCSRGVNRMVCHDSIQYRFSYPAIRYLPIPQKIIWYDSIQEYIDRYIGIIILYTYFKQPFTFLLTHKCNQNI